MPPTRRRRPARELNGLEFRQDFDRTFRNSRPRAPRETVLNAGAERAPSRRPPQLRATAQSALSTTYYVLGAGVGSVLWSVAYESFGARPTYLAGAALAAASGALLLPQLKKRAEPDLEPPDLV